MEKTRFYCCCCGEEIPYKSKAYSKNDGDSECPIFCSADCLCDYYDYYYSQSNKKDVLDLFTAMQTFPNKPKPVVKDAFWLNNDLFGDIPIVIFSSAEKLCEYYKYIFSWRGVPEYMDTEIENEEG